MKNMWIPLFCLISANVQALDYEIIFENDSIKIAKAILEAHEEVPPHRDEYPRILIAPEGGELIRIEADDSQTTLTLLPWEPAYLPMDPPDQLHRTVNNSNNPLELTIIDLKN